MTKPTFNNILLFVQRDNGESLVVEPGEAVDDVGAREGIDIVHTEVEGGLPVDGPRLVVTHDLEIFWATCIKKIVVIKVLSRMKCWNCCITVS